MAGLLLRTVWLSYLRDNPAVELMTLVTAIIYNEDVNRKKILRYLGITHFSPAAIFYFSFPNIFKIKNKILLTFSVESQNG